MAIRSAGLIGFSATLSFRSVEDLPRGPTLPALPEGVRCSVVETDDPAEGRREVLGEILALTEGELGLALETVLRSLTIAAALSDAVLEARTICAAPVRPAPASTLQALALDLHNAGFPVRFAATWTPVVEGEIGLGVRGAEQELLSLLAAHPSWRSHAGVPSEGMRQQCMPGVPFTHRVSTR